ncbi:rhodanese-related sulfurtransferase [Ulvibacter sp. MAR_2010_11]|uniref:rhodanese-like domain-containing protein n=1 Tax=Ulvibacter sp. MAR_2010_11 TaxID=1250229 RepID=UPI000C2C25A7|nr:rhodanese-like domain-containing protein [Ulvibacter sp. MAR_2010_11]PKA83584.1 rhodanese-related sulfurtransferase [Ulvibacter sp. MAR_2010_11]
MDLSQSQWREQLSNDDNAVILDVRTEEEVNEGHIPNMKHLDIYNAGAFMEKAQQMDTSKNYYVYCRSGGRSAQACAILNSLGYKNTFNLLGGFSEWEGERTV